MTGSMPALRRIARTMARSVCTWRRSIRGSRTLLPRLATTARCFVVTSKRKDFAARIVRSLEFAAAIEGVYGTEQDGSMDDKARLIAAVLHNERLDPNATIMVGDRSHDIIGARANGLRAIGVLWGYGSRDELEAAGADALIATSAELGSLAS